MARPFYTAQAQRDLREIYLYVTRESGDRKVGGAFVAKLRARCDRLASLDATLGTHRPDLRPDIRSTPANGYIIFFRYAESAVEIINILHGSRDVIAHFDPD